MTTLEILQLMLHYGFSDATKIFRIYTEAILCVSTEQAEKPRYLWGDPYYNEKYIINIIDFDIITKFVPAKDLYNLINKYKIEKLKTSKDNASLLCYCFKNLCCSLVKGNTYGYHQSSLTTLINLVQILMLVDLEDEDKEVIMDSLISLFNNQVFNEQFFSITNEYRISTKILARLCRSLTFTPNIDVINNIVNSRNFYEYAVNVNFSYLRDIIMSFAKQELSIETQNTIKDMIDKELSFNKKNLLLHVLYKCLTNEGIKRRYIDYLTSHFISLDALCLST